MRFNGDPVNCAEVQLILRLTLLQPRRIPLSYKESIGDWEGSRSCQGWCHSPKPSNNNCHTVIWRSWASRIRKTERIVAVLQLVGPNGSGLIWTFNPRISHETLRWIQEWCYHWKYWLSIRPLGNGDITSEERGVWGKWRSLFLTMKKLSRLAWTNWEWFLAWGSYMKESRDHLNELSGITWSAGHRT